ncbi:AAA family ATPase [Arthrobacter sp. YD4]|uniref:ParA family protein n=1 Tax=Arthrobacter sp. YD4 TaxID=3058043 RepID=UPI0025B44F68|nr:AAA family ATPase [Arthrobacter sp. YD4]MDN3936635.1 AAA family ATPase [Arthrobacter sp. YD4]
MKTVSFFNHKGGVGKTTLLFNVGLAMAKHGKTVLFIDADAQTNLTGAALSSDKYEEVLNRKATIYNALEPVIKTIGEPNFVEPVKIRDGAYLLPGDIRLSEFEEVLPAAWTDSIAGIYQGFQRTTAVDRLTRHLAAQVGADYVLVDLGPSVGALNRVVMLGSDGFVVPLAPDLFSLTALPSVGKSVHRWVEEWRTAKQSAARTGVADDLPYDLPAGTPSPLGYVSQQFASYRSAPAAAFQRWIDKIPQTYESGVVGPLRSAGVTIPAASARLGEVKNLSSLVPMAQQKNLAVFELTGSEARGSQYTRAQDTLKLFKDLSDRIVTRLDQVVV